MSSQQNSSSNQIQWSQGVSQSAPWAVQTPYLQNAFQQAQNAYDTNMAQGPYKGDYVAGTTPQTTSAFNQAYNFGTNANNNASVQNQLDNSNGLINSGTDWANQGASGLAGLSGDQTQNLINQAGAYSNNPYISGAVNAAMYDANQEAANSTLPNLYRSAAGSNALNSDRATLQDATVRNNLNNQAANISSTMRQNAWNSGLSTAQNELNARRSGYGTLANLGQSAVGLGQAGLTSGIADQSRLNQMSAAGATGNQQNQQLDLNNAMAKYQGNQNFPWAALDNYYNVIGSNNWGGTTAWSQMGGGKSDSQTTSNPGAASIAGGALGSIGSLLSGGSGSAMSGLGGLFSFL